MSNPSYSFEECGIINTAVAIDKDKNSQFAVKWAVEKLKLKDNKIAMIHVRTPNTLDSRDMSKGDMSKEVRNPTHTEIQQLFLPYRGFCARKGIRAKEVVLQDLDIAKALSEYIRSNSITTIVLGASNRSTLARAFKAADVSSSLGKCAPDSCTVYVVSKGKLLKLKSSNQPDTPSSSTASDSTYSFSGDSRRSAELHPQESWKSSISEQLNMEESSQTRLSEGKKNALPLSSTIHHGREHQQTAARERLSWPSNSNEFLHKTYGEKQDTTKSPVFMESVNASYESVFYGNSYSSSLDSRLGDSPFEHVPLPNRQQSNNIVPTLQSNNLNLHLRTKNSSTNSLSGSSHSDGLSFPSEVSFETVDHGLTSDSSKSSTSSQVAEIEDELRRLKQDLKEITTQYKTACQEALTAKNKVREIVPGSNLEEVKQAQESTMAVIEIENQKCKAALEMAEKSQRIAELESEKRKQAEMMYRQEAHEKKKAIDALTHNEIQYRKYTTKEIEVATNYFSDAEKIGEGGYGPVFKAHLDHTAVAIKVLRPDMSQGEKQFHQEVEVLSRMRHPHMVILLGVCPEYGCLVYEHMENGSLEDRLYRKDGSRPLPWSFRFRIAAEIGTALNFLHRTRPEPLVHRDLKPANILLDKNYVSKIADVGLARLVPASVANSVTQYHMTAAAGTFCYIDPEYQQTGMLGTKSDIYSLGVILLQILTAKPAMGLTHQVGHAIETGKFEQILDPTVKDWPVEDAMCLAKLALRCCELRKKDRPDLDSVILPELQRLKDLGSQFKPKGRFYYRYSESRRIKGSQESLESNPEIQMEE